MFQLKPLSKDAVPAALARAERYRFLNEPAEAESICLDVLNVDPDNPEALVMLLLALTDQFQQDHGEQITRAREVVPRLSDEYQRLYYTGIICERSAKAVLDQGSMGSGTIAYDWLRQAMSWYEKAEVIRHPDNDDALLRWNTCARLIDRRADLKPRDEEAYEPLLLE